MKIKTITAQLPTEFDNAVNAALAQGYELKKRDVLPLHTTVVDGCLHEWPRMYYAELELIPCCDNCKHEACDPDDPTSPCHRCEHDEMWEARGS